MRLLKSQFSSVLQTIKDAYYHRHEALFETQFGGVKVGRLDSDGKLSIIASNQKQADLLNARFCTIVKTYMRAINQDVRQVVFVTERELEPELVVFEEDKTDDELTLEVAYSGEYDAIVRPERIIAIPKYFFRHISRIGAENAWLYLGFRQAAYQLGLHHGVRQLSLSASQIYRWAGIHEVTFWRRIAKPDTWKGLKGFVVKGKSGDWVQSNVDGKPHREPNHYIISMTIPLTPGDVISLRSYMIGESEHNGIEDAVMNALSVPLDRLIPGLDREANCDPMTVYQLVTSLGSSSKAASALQAHLMPYSDVVVMTQYFVETWLPKLGEPASWMITWLRDNCNAHGQITTSIQDIMNVTGVERERTIRDWLRGNGVYRLFVREDSRTRARGATSMRDLIVRLNEPLKDELAADATISTDKQQEELVGDASISNEESSVNWSELQFKQSENAKNSELVGDASISSPDSTENWSEMQANLVGDASIRGVENAGIGRRCYGNWSEMQESISINNKNLLKLSINESSTLLTINESINKRCAKEKIDAHPIPEESQEGQRQQEAVDDTDEQFISAPDDVPELQADQGEVEEAGVEPADPQELFQRILKQAEVAPKIQHRFQGKPFYPFLCWLIYGASRGKIEDPVGFAISRYDQGLPESQVIKDLARDLDGLLDDLDYFENFWSLPPLLAQVFESNTSRVRMLAKILAG